MLRLEESSHTRLLLVEVVELGAPRDGLQVVHPAAVPPPSPPGTVRICQEHVKHLQRMPEPISMPCFILQASHFHDLISDDITLRATMPAQ